MKISVVAIVAMCVFSVVADAQKWVYRHIFSEGRASVQDAKGLWGYIDKTGKEIIPFNFKLALPFENGVAKVHSDQHVWLKVDKTGKFVE